MRHGRSGFTLIELLVGLAIMVMIATVVTPVMLGSLDRTRVRQGAQALQSLAASLSGFEDDVGEWPGTLSQLSEPITTAHTNSCGNVYQPGDVSKWAGPYVDRVITTSGLPAFVGTVQNQLQREPGTQSGGGNFGYLRMIITGVSAADAVALDREIDGVENPAEGTILRSAPATDGTVTVTYRIPAKGC